MTISWGIGLDREQWLCAIKFWFFKISPTLCLSDLRLTDVFSYLGEDIGYGVAGSLAFKSFVQDANSKDRSPQLLFSYPCIQCNIVHCNTVHSHEIFLTGFLSLLLIRKPSLHRKTLAVIGFLFFFPVQTLSWSGFFITVFLTFFLFRRPFQL